MHTLLRREKGNLGERERKKSGWALRLECGLKTGLNIGGGAVRKEGSKSDMEECKKRSTKLRYQKILYAKGVNGKS